MSEVAVGLRSERGPILLAVMLSTALVALDATIIATAVPSIVDSIGGFTEFPWLFSIYLLAQAVTVPVYGKLADIFGRRPMMLTGIALFFVGSIMCGLAWSMPVLIAFRVVQGLGAGAIQPMAMTIVGDLYTLHERARVQGYLASVWGVSAVLGPTLGGALSQYVSWRWIFFVNIPVCLLAATMLIRNFQERVDRARPAIDYRGAALLTTGSTLLILGILEGGQAWAWDSPASAAVLGLGAALTVAFVLVERRTAVPMLPLWVFTRRLLLASSLVAFGVGAVVLGITSYIPTFSQVVLGTGPVTAGLAIATLTIGWPLAAALCGRLYLRIGFRRTALIGSVLVVAGTGLLTLIDERSSLAALGVICFVIGLGMGLVAPPTLVAAQSSVGWGERGVVTGNNMFCRSLGSAVGIAVFGAVANAALGARAVRSPAALTTATHRVFIGVVAVSVAMAAAVALMPRGDRPQAPEAVAGGLAKKAA